MQHTAKIAPHLIEMLFLGKKYSDNTQWGEIFPPPLQLCSNKGWGSLHSKKKEKGLCPSLYERLEETKQGMALYMPAEQTVL